MRIVNDFQCFENYLQDKHFLTKGLENSLSKKRPHKSRIYPNPMRERLRTSQSFRT